MKEPRCKICNDPAASTAVRQLRTEGLPIRAIAERLRLSASSVDRHCRNHLKKRKTPATRRERKRFDEASQAGRNAGQRKKRTDEGRCDKCLVSLLPVDPVSLSRRGERLLFLAEETAIRAHEEEDARLMLQALDKARQATELLMKSIGMLKIDAPTTIDKRQINIFEGLSVDAILSLRESLRQALQPAPETIDQARGAS